MSNIKKKQVNPFLFLLMKQMLTYEFFGTSNAESDLEIAKRIYDRHKSVSFARSHFQSSPSKRDKNAHTRAERIRKHLLAPEVLSFSDKMLDHLVAEITKLGRFSSWKEYELKFKTFREADAAEINYMDVPYPDLSDTAQSDIKRLVNMAFERLCSRVLKGHLHSRYRVIADTEEFVIRTAGIEDIKKIENLAKRVYPCPINGFDTKKPWYDKNPNIFFIYEDDVSLWANINLLPLNERAYTALKTGRIYESDITQHDIHSLDEKDKVTYIYVEGIACPVSNLLPLFAIYFKDMISKLAELSNKNLVICAIGGSKEGDRLMQRCGFEKTGETKDPKEKKTYPFLETSWASLEAQLQKRALKPHLLLKKDRLTPINE